MKCAINYLIYLSIFILPFFSVPSSFSGERFELRQAISFALKNSPMLSAARSGVNATKFQIKESKGRFLPQITGYAGYDRKSDPVVVVPIKGFGQKPPAFSRDQYRIGLSLIIPVYEGGRLRAKLDMARFSKEMEENSLSFTRQDLIANLINVFNQALYLKELEKARHTVLSALKKAQKDARLKLKLGRIAPVELMRIDTQVAQQEQELISTIQSKKRALYALSLLMGWDRTAPLEITGKLTHEKSNPYLSKSFNELLNEAFEKRADILAAKAAVKKAEAELRYEKGGHLPSLSLVGDYSRHAGSGLHYDEEVWSGGVSLSINIFSGGIISAKVGEAASKLERAHHLLREAKLRAKRQILDAISEIKEASHRLKVSKTALKTAKETYRIEQLRYDTGAGTITDALLAQSAWKEAIANELMAKYGLKKAFVDLKFALGVIDKEAGEN